MCRVGSAECERPDSSDERGKKKKKKKRSDTSYAMKRRKMKNAYAQFSGNGNQFFFSRELANGLAEAATPTSPGGRVLLLQVGGHISIATLLAVKRQAVVACVYSDPKDCSIARRYLGVEDPEVPDKLKFRRLRRKEQNMERRRERAMESGCKKKPITEKFIMRRLPNKDDVYVMDWAMNPKEGDREGVAGAVRDVGLIRETYPGSRVVFLVSPVEPPYCEDREWLLGLIEDNAQDGDIIACDFAGKENIYSWAPLSSKSVRILSNMTVEEACDKDFQEDAERCESSRFYIAQFCAASETNDWFPETKRRLNLPSARKSNTAPLCSGWDIKDTHPELVHLEGFLGRVSRMLWQMEDTCMFYQSKVPIHVSGYGVGPSTTPQYVPLSPFVRMIACLGVAPENVLCPYEEHHDVPSLGNRPIAPGPVVFCGKLASLYACIYAMRYKKGRGDRRSGRAYLVGRGGEVQEGRKEVEEWKAMMTRRQRFHVNKNLEVVGGFEGVDQPFVKVFVSGRMPEELSGYISGNKLKMPLYCCFSGNESPSKCLQKEGQAEQASTGWRRVIGSRCSPITIGSRKRVCLMQFGERVLNLKKRQATEMRVWDVFVPEGYTFEGYDAEDSADGERKYATILEKGRKRRRIKEESASSAHRKSADRSARKRKKTKKKK